MLAAVCLCVFVCLLLSLQTHAGRFIMIIIIISVTTINPRNTDSAHFWFTAPLSPASGRVTSSVLALSDITFDSVSVCLLKNVVEYYFTSCLVVSIYTYSTILYYKTALETVRE